TTASTPCRYASLTMMALPENAIAPPSASRRPGHGRAAGTGAARGIELIGTLSTRLRGCAAAGADARLHAVRNPTCMPPSSTASPTLISSTAAGRPLRSLGLGLALVVVLPLLWALTPQYDASGTLVAPLQPALALALAATACF